MGKGWFRFYADFLTDSTIGMMSDLHQILWVKTLCLASDSKRKGVVLLSDEEIAWKLRISVEDWQEAARGFVAQNLMEKTGDGYRVVDWDYNQRHRDRLPATEWRDIRSAVFERDNHTCQYCGARGVKLQCDHVLPISRGGSNEMENLATACERCNLRKHAKTPQEWLGDDWNSEA